MAQASERTRGPEITGENEESHPRTKRTKLHAPAKLYRPVSNRSITEESGRKMKSPISKKPTGLRQGVVNKGASASNPKRPPQALVGNPGLHSVRTNPSQGAAKKGAAASQLLTKPKRPLASKSSKPAIPPKKSVLSPQSVSTGSIASARKEIEKGGLQVERRTSGKKPVAAPRPFQGLKEKPLLQGNKAKQDSHPVTKPSTAPSSVVPTRSKLQDSGRRLQQSSSANVSISLVSPAHLKDTTASKSSKASPSSETPLSRNQSPSVSSIPSPAARKKPPTLAQKPTVPPKKPVLLPQSVSTPYRRKEIGKGCLQVERRTSGKNPVAAPRPFHSLKEKPLLQGNKAKQDSHPVTKSSTAPSSVVPTRSKLQDLGRRLQSGSASMSISPVPPAHLKDTATSKSSKASPSSETPPSRNPSPSVSSIPSPAARKKPPTLAQKPTVPPMKSVLLPRSVSTGNFPNGRKETKNVSLLVERKLETSESESEGKKPVAAPRPVQDLKENVLLQENKAKQEGPVPATKPFLSTAPSLVRPVVPAEPKLQTPDNRLQRHVQMKLPSENGLQFHKEEEKLAGSVEKSSDSSLLTVLLKPVVPAEPKLQTPDNRLQRQTKLTSENGLQFHKEEEKLADSVEKSSNGSSLLTVLLKTVVPAIPRVQNSADRRLHSNGSVSLPTARLKDEAANGTLKVSLTSKSTPSQNPSFAQNSVGTMDMEKSTSVPTPDDGDVKSTGPNQSQLEIAQHPLQRGELWCKLPEVVERGVLKTLDKEEKKLQEVMFEFVSTEETYLRGLNVLIEHFVDDPGMNPNLPEGKSVLDKRQHHVIFSNVREVRDVSARFLEDLQKRQRESVVVRNISDIILEYAENHFHCYIWYCSNQTYQTRELQDCIRRNKMFREYLKQLESNKRCQNLHMQSFLLLPMQRITRMSLLIQTILSNTPLNHPGHQMVENTLRTVQELVTACDDGAGQTKRIEELHSIYQRLDFVDTESIPVVSENRQLEKKGTLIQLRVKGKPLAISKKSPRYFFVFTDYLIITKKRQDPSRGGDVYKVVDYASRSQIVVVDIECQPWVTFPENVPVANTETAAMATAVSTANVKNAFLVLLLDNAHHTTANYIFQAQNDTDKTEWMKSLIRREAMHEWGSLAGLHLDPGLHAHTLQTSSADCPQVQAIHEYKAKKPDELSLMRGDVIKVCRKMANGWYEGEKLQRGWFPSNYTVEIAKTSEHSSHTHGALQTMDSPSADCPQVQAIHEYKARQPNELGLLRGDVIKVYRKMANGWCEGKRLRDFRCGLFPSTYTVEMKEAHKRLSFPTRLTQYPYWQSTQWNSMPVQKA